MNLEKYGIEAKRTMSECETPLLDDLHMILGIQTESAEIADVYKKNIAYGKDLDLVNVKEEIGDLMWYIVNLCTLKGWDLEDIIHTNINKLKARFPEKFTNENALNRDLDLERAILETERGSAGYGSTGKN